MSLCVEGDLGPQHTQIKTWREKRPCILTIIQKNRYFNAKIRKTCMKKAGLRRRHAIYVIADHKRHSQNKQVA